jgi:hypothetical protein
VIFSITPLLRLPNVVDGAVLLCRSLAFGEGNAKFSELAGPHRLVIDSTCLWVLPIFNPEDNPVIGMPTAYDCRIV